MGKWKLNVDASLYPGQRGAGVVGIIRNHQGVLFGAMLKHYAGDMSVEVAEMMAIWDGLRFLLTNRFRDIVVESDMSSVVSSIKNNVFR